MAANSIRKIIVTPLSQPEKKDSKMLRCRTPITNGDVLPHRALARTPSQFRSNQTNSEQVGGVKRLTACHAVCGSVHEAGCIGLLGALHLPA